MTALNLENIRVSYGDTLAVEDVSLRVEPGEVHALLGASGAGKTTILRAIAGFERVDSGRICMGTGCVDDGQRWTPPEQRNVGVVFQDYALFPHLSVARNVAFGMKQPSDEAVRELLERVGLPEAASKRPAMLSGGEQQRVALARALGQAPRLLLLDEPFAHLDPSRRDTLRDETLALVRRAEVATLLVTHDATDALASADVVHVVHEGRLEQSGDPRALYDAPANPVVARAVGPLQLLDADVEEGDVARTALGPVRLREAAARGSRGSVLLRPEWLALVGPDEARGVDARVTRRAFHGADAELELELTSGRTVKVRVRAWEAPEGDAVRVAVARPGVFYEGA